MEIGVRLGVRLQTEGFQVQVYPSRIEGATLDDGEVIRRKTDPWF